jgi:hypothetical protein
MPTDYEDSVFINCPFDDAYKSVFNAIVFAIHDSGFVARCALEVDNAAQNRLGKITQIIAECKYGIHDISRTELDPTTSLPRFNMPLELGIYLGCREFGDGHHKSKVCLVIDREPYRYQKFISDIAGQDIFAYNDREQVINGVRKWLRTSSGRTNIPGGVKIYERYMQFEDELPRICSTLNITIVELTFVDFTYIVTEWLAIHPLQ